MSIIPIRPDNEEENSTTHEPSGSDLAPIDDGLTYKQRLFAEAYTGQAKGNARMAAQIAGYQGDANTLTAYGCRLLQHPTIRAYVHARALAVMSEHETIDHLATYIRNPPSNPIERNAWVKAVETMMKYHGVLTDKVEHSGTVQQQIRQIVVTLTPTDTTIIDSQATEKEEEKE